MQLACVLYLAGLVASVGAGESDAKGPEPVDDALRANCLKVLRTALQKEAFWAKFRAAEYLLSLDYADGVTDSFQAEVDRASKQPGQRIAVWQLLAHEAGESPQAKRWKAKIRDVAFDSAAPDQDRALDTLGRLRYKIPRDELADFKKLSAEGRDVVRVYAAWVLLNSGQPGAEQRLVDDFLRHGNEAAVAAAAYVLSQTNTLSDEARRTLLKAADDEAGYTSIRAKMAAAAARHAQGAEQTRWIEALREYTRSGTDEQRLLALETLAAIGQPSDIPDLSKCLDDSSAEVSAAAAWALLRIERRTPRTLGTWDWVVIAVYMLAMLGIGWYYWYQSDTSEEYLLGGRKMKALPVGLSLFATLFSTISYLAWPGEMIKNGPMVFSLIVAYPLVAIVAGFFLIPYIMRLRITSAYELLETRLGLTVRLLGSAIFLVLRLFWMAVIIYATVHDVLMPLLGLEPWVVPLLSAALGIITLIYTAMGGLKAVVVTDVLQALILFAGAIAAIIAVSVYLGGVTAWWPTGWAPHWTEPRLWDPNVRITFLPAVIATFTWYISTAGSDQMAIQRYLATRDASSARSVLNTSLIANTLVFVLLSALGLALLAFFQGRPELLADGNSVVGDADRLFSRFIVVGLPHGFSGLVVAGLLAAAMSSLSAGINSSCSVIAVDFFVRLGWRKPPNPQEANQAWFERVLSVGIGVVVVGLSLFVGMVPGNLLDLSYKIVNPLAAPLFGLFFMAMFVRWSTPLGTLVGAVVGIAVVVVLSLWKEIFGVDGLSFLWAMPLSLVAQIIVGTVVSLIPIGRRPYVEV